MSVSVGGRPAFDRILLSFERGEPIREWARMALIADNDRHIEELARIVERATTRAESGQEAGA